MNIRLLPLLIVLCAACGSNSSDTDKEKTKEQTVVQQVEPEKKLKDPKLFRFDTLENIFTNDNWLLINGKDSSYFYFSRLGKTAFNTYYYHLTKGDTLSTIKNDFQLKQDTICWKFGLNNTELHVEKVAHWESIWADSSNSSYYTFKRIANNKIMVTMPNQKVYYLIKTLPFSLFLIRSKYDFLHGTHYAFSDTNFTKGKKHL